jgi:hypothetical protein
MRRFFVFVFVSFLFVIPASFYVQAKSTQQTNKTEVYSKNISISSPTQDAVVDGNFVIKGTAAPSSEKITSVEVILTQLYDKRQKAVKVYEASYDPRTAQWVVQVKHGDVPDDVYTLCVEAEAGNGNKQTTYSTVVVDSLMPQEKEHAGETI